MGRVNRKSVFLSHYLCFVVQTQFIYFDSITCFSLILKATHITVCTSYYKIQLRGQTAQTGKSENNDAERESL